MIRRLVVNPLILKDGLARVRTWRAPAVIALYLGLLGVFAWGAFATQLTPYQRSGGFAQIGSNVFLTLAMVQLALVCLVAPAVAAGSISGERERQTLDVLLVTCVPSFGIVWGKLVASVAFVLLLILSALPLFATVFLFGGVDGGQFVAAQVLTVTTALAVAAVSVFLSALLRRTLSATVVAYALTFAATAPAWVIGTAMLASGHIRTGQALLFASPIQAMLTVLHVAPVGYATRTVVCGSGGGCVVSPVAAPVFQPWHVTAGIELALVALGVAGTVLLLRGRRGLSRS